MASSGIMSFCVPLPNEQILRPDDLISRTFPHKYKHKYLYKDIPGSIVCHREKPDTDRTSPFGHYLRSVWYIHTMEYYAAVKKNGVSFHTLVWINVQDTLLRTKRCCRIMCLVFSLCLFEYG